MSKDIGAGNLRRASAILEKCGGITGYTALPQGKKKPIRDEIKSKCHFADDRSVYNILSKIKEINKS